MWSVSMIGTVSMGLFLGILTLLDIMYQEVPLWLLLSGSGAVIIIWMISGSPNWSLLCMGGLMGCLFLVISYVTRQAFGYADSILILMFGISLGIWNLMQLLCYAFLLSAIFAIIQMIRHHFSRKTTYPFIPFLALGYLGVMFL